MFEARYDLISMRKRNETRWWKSVKETERTTILVESRFWFSALEAHFHRFSIFSSSFFPFFFFERVTLIGWMRVVPRLRLLEIREICRTGENWLAKRQAKERNESTFQSIMFHRRVSIREDPGTRMCKDLSLLLFPIASTDPIVGNSFDRDDAANLDF